MKECLHTVILAFPVQMSLRGFLIILFGWFGFLVLEVFLSVTTLKESPELGLNLASGIKHAFELL